MRKKIIFIGGTGRSGSTLLNLILANDPKAMALGEISALFHPTKKHHFAELKKVKKNATWNQILKDGKKRLFLNLQKSFPDVDIFIDSSKNPFWQKYHDHRNKELFDIKHVLIYKSPSELANSYIKRGMTRKWVSFYRSYHKKYMGLIDDFVSISYKDLVSDEQYLNKLCSKLGIEYFEGKKEYWNKDSDMFFGSNSVKSENAHTAQGELSKQERRSVTYDPINSNFMDMIDKMLVDNQDLFQIENQIKERDVMHPESILKSKQYGYNEAQIYYYLLKLKVKRLYRYLFPYNMYAHK